MADSLIAKLARCVENADEIKMGLHYFLPLHRYLRGEVFAMAIVAITGRLLFKLDGDYEVCGWEICQSQCKSIMDKLILIVLHAIDAFSLKISEVGRQRLYKNRSLRYPRNVVSTLV